MCLLDTTRKMSKLKTDPKYLKYLLRYVVCLDNFSDAKSTLRATRVSYTLYSDHADGYIL